MTINHSTAVRNAIADLVVDKLDEGTTNSTGRLKIYTTGKTTLLATLDLSDPAFGIASSGTATANTITRLYRK